LIEIKEIRQHSLEHVWFWSHITIKNENEVTNATTIEEGVVEISSLNVLSSIKGRNERRRRWFLP